MNNKKHSSWRQRLVGPCCMMWLWLLPGPASAANGQKLLSWLPAGVESIVAVNVEQARSSPLFGQLVKLIRDDPRFSSKIKEIEQATGLKVERDLKTMVIASVPGDRYRLRGFVLLEGKFQQAKIEKKLSQNKELTQQQRAGRKVWSRGGRSMAFDVIFLRPDLIGFIHPSLSAEVIGRATAKGQPALSGELQALLARPDKNGSSWFAGSVPKEMRGNPEAGPLAQAEGGFGSLKLADDLAGSFTGVFVNETMAQNLSGMLMMLRGRIAQRPQVRQLGLEPVLNRLTAIPQGREARVDLQITKAELEQIMAQLPAFLDSYLAPGPMPTRRAVQPATTTSEAGGNSAGSGPGTAAPSSAAAAPGTMTPAGSAPAPGSATPVEPKAPLVQPEPVTGPQ